MKGGWPHGGLNICHMSADSFVFKQKTYCSFLQMEGGSQDVAILLEVVVSFRLQHQARSQIYFDYVENNTPASPPTHSSPNSIDYLNKGPVPFSWHLIFYVKKYFGLLNIASWLVSNKTLWTRKCNRCSWFMEFFLFKASSQASLFAAFSDLNST